jgi:inhibitor of the pro-sigma K processing machinery
MKGISEKMTTIGSYLIGIVLLIIVLKIISMPFKIITKFIFNSIIGGIILYVCYFFGIGITLYWWTILLTGLFGVPGFVLSAIITMFI